ncbi:cadherin repeat domain-containing protein, partial [bacterium]|nr:cadherin repeat domain-containing protein [bacterium]
MSDSNFQKVLVSGPVVNDDGTRSIVVQYQTDDSATTGLGLAVSFDSSSLSLTGSSLLNSTDNIAAGNESVDGATQTVTFAWASLFGTWPGVTESDLFELTFETVDGGGTNYDVEFATTSVAAGFTPVLPGPTAILTSPLAVTLNTIDENSGEGQVVASVDGGPSGAVYTLVDNTVYGDQPDQPDQAETVISVPASAASTQQVYVSSSTTSEDGTQETVVISYNSDSAATTGLGLDIHFDSSKVSASDVTALVGTDLLVNGSIKSDDNDLDGDASTDQIVSFGWASLFGNWPGSESADLAEITFDIAEGAEGAFDLNFTASSTAAGYAFVGQNQEIAIQTVVQPPLTIDSATGDVTLNVNPDYESVENYDFVVMANAGTDSEDSQSVTLEIGNIDEVAPTVTSSSTADAVDENTSSVVIYTATADDSGDTSDGVVFSLGENSDSVLSIDENTGEVSLDVSVDFESQQEISFSVIATDAAGNASTEQSVTVDVTNLDEVEPTITSSSVTQMIEENSSVGDVIYTATADDSMDVSNGDLTFYLMSDAGGKVSIDSSTGEVTLDSNLDYETDTDLTFSVFAEDSAFNPGIPLTVTINLQNLDDSAPIFMSGSDISLTEGNGGIEETHSNDESSYMSQVVWTPMAYEEYTDLESGIRQYTIADDHGGVFSIDSMTGAVSLDVAPDFEDENLALNDDMGDKYFHFTITVEDFAGNTAEQSVKLYVKDVAELPPVFKDSVDTEISAADLDIDENNDSSVIIYTANAVANPIVAFDTGSDSVVYSLADEMSSDFYIDSMTGEVSLMSVTDHEMQSSYSFTVVATDTLGNVNQLPVTLTVNDLDEVAPTITSGDTAAAIDENEDAQVIYTATADDSADISNGVTFSLGEDSDSALSIDSETGEVSVNVSPDHETQSVYSFIVIATDAANNVSSEQSVSLDINDLDDTAATITSGDTADAIDENTGAAQVIYTATADDSADVSDGVSFSLAAGSDAALSIDAASGAVTLSADPDADTQSVYDFTVVVTDVAGNASEQAVSLDINNLDEVAPTITSADTADAVDENSGTQVIYTVTSDDSADVSGGVTYSLAAGSDAALSIKASSGAVILNVDPDAETQSQYSFTVVATDEAGNASEQAVTLDINDLDDTAPVITSPSTAAVLESKGAGVSVYQAIVDDSADVNDGTLIYSLTGDDASAFEINTSGSVTLLDDPEADTQAEYNFTVVVTDGGNNSSEQSVTLTVVDQDLEAPEFTSTISVAIDENSGADQAVYVATVQESSPYSFALSDSSDSALTIDAASGVVTLAGDPDAEVQAQYDFTVVATDEAGNSSEHPVTLAINDFDEIAPTITSSASASVDETGSAGEFIYAASSHDSQSVIEQGPIAQQFVRNEDGTLTVRLFVDSSIAQDYSAGLEALNFTLEYSSDEQGVLAVESIDFPSNPLSAIPNDQGDAISFAMYFTTPEFAEVATNGAEANLYDTSGNTPIAEVTFSVGNDFASNQFTVSEAGLTEYNGGTAFPGGQSVSEYQMADSDSSVFYSLSEVSDADLAIDSATGNVYLNSALDHESVDQYSFTVVASDDQGNSSSQAVTISVNDLDEAAPVITSGAIGASVDENSGSQVIYTATASDNGDVSDGVTFSLAAGSDSALTIDASTGEVTLADSPDHEAQDEYAFTVVATDAAGNSLDQSVTVAVNDLDEAAPTITSSNSAGSIDENVGLQVVYTASAEDAGDVSGGYVWSLSGTDSEVFAINASSGDVTMLVSPDYESQSEYSFSVVATDAAGNSSEQAVSLSVNNLDEVAAVITSADTAQAIAENSGSAQVIYAAAADDSADVSNGVTFSLSDDSDSALSIDSSTGAVSLADNPDFEAQSAYNFTVVATDAAGNAASKSVSLSVTNVDESAPTITSGDSVSITENTGVNQVIYTATSTDNGDVSDGVTYSLAEGSDVALSVDAESGVVTLAKNPNYELQNEFSFTVVATDAAGNNSDSQEVTVSVVDSMLYTVTHWSSDVVLENVTMVDGTPQKELENADVNRVVTASDALDALKLSVGLSVDSYQESDNAKMFQQLSADVNQDGKISSADAYALLLSAARVENSFQSEWKFVEMEQGTDSVSYAGYVLGDVDGSWASSSDAPVINLQESTLEGQVVYNFDARANTIAAKDDGLSVDLAAGEVSLSADADYEAVASYSFTMVNNYSGAEQSFTVSVVNEDESAPVIVSSATVSLAEDSGADQVVYVAVADDSADVSDGVTYTLAENSDPALSIDSETGDVTLSDNPDHSVTAEYNFTVIATDAAGKFDAQAVTINVEPTPDSEAPEFYSGDTAAAIDE